MAAPGPLTDLRRLAPFVFLGLALIVLVGASGLSWWTVQSKTEVNYFSVMSKTTMECSFETGGMRLHSVHVAAGEHREDTALFTYESDSVRDESPVISSVLGNIRILAAAAGAVLFLAAGAAFLDLTGRGRQMITLLLAIVATILISLPLAAAGLGLPGAVITDNADRALCGVPEDTIRDVQGSHSLGNPATIYSSATWGFGGALPVTAIALVLAALATLLLLLPLLGRRQVVVPMALPVAVPAPPVVHHPAPTVAPPAPAPPAVAAGPPHVVAPVPPPGTIPPG